MERKPADIKITEAYNNYRPPPGIRKTIQLLLTYVPSDYLYGLGEFHLTNFSGQPRGERRRKVSTGTPMKNTRGFYRQKYKGQKASITIFVDKTMPKKRYILLFFFPLFRKSIIAEVLYHEIGHHVEALKIRPGNLSENFAENMSEKLNGKFLRKRYWYIVQPVRWIVKVIKLFKTRARSTQGAK